MTRRPLLPALLRLARARQGAAAVETAFVLPLAILMLFGLVETGRLVWTQAALDYAVQEAARCASVRPGQCGADADVAKYAADKVSALRVPASAFATDRIACGVQVTATYDFKLLVPNILPSAPTLTAQACRA